MQHLWTEGVKAPAFPSLEGDRSTEVLIIGGGMAGVLCARRLSDAGAECLLIEGRRLGLGITRGTTAVLTAQHDTLYQDMIKSLGLSRARLYLRANLRAVDSFRAMARDIDCDFEDMPSVMYSLVSGRLMRREAETVRRLGFEAYFTGQTPMPFPVAGAVVYPKMAQFHPLKLLYGAAEGLNILENTFVRRLEGTTAITDNGRIHAQKVVVATHFPFVNSHGLYFAKLYQRRAYVVAYDNAPRLGCSIEDGGSEGFFLRNYNGLLLIGGGDHRTGRRGGGFKAVRDFAARYFPGAREQYAWANQDCVSLDGAPYIGPYSAGLPNVYVASGFNLWGMTSSMAAAEALADMVMGRESELAPAFDPGRSMLHSQLLGNMASTAAGFAVPTLKRCPHMGCALKWNPAEHSWDCPCHGSRFDSRGHLIDGPAMRDANVE